MTNDELLDLLKTKISSDDMTLTKAEMVSIGEQLTFIKYALFVNYDPSEPYTQNDVDDGIRDDLTLRFAGMSSARRYHAVNGSVPDIVKPLSDFECGWNEYSMSVNHPEIFTECQHTVWKPFTY